METLIYSFHHGKTLVSIVKRRNPITMLVHTVCVLCSVLLSSPARADSVNLISLRLFYYIFLLLSSNRHVKGLVEANKWASISKLISLLQVRLDAYSCIAAEDFGFLFRSPPHCCIAFILLRSRRLPHSNAFGAVVVSCQLTY